MIVVKKFSASWCGPCKALAPVFEEVKSESNASFEDIDIDQNPMEAINSKVRSVPTVVVYKNGEEVARLVGPKPKQIYLETIKSFN